MTPEKLDEIEKRWDRYLEKTEVERRFLFEQWWDKRDFWDMTKALREMQKELEIERRWSAMLQGIAAKALEERGEALREVQKLLDAVDVLKRR